MLKNRAIVFLTVVLSVCFALFFMSTYKPQTAKADGTAPTLSEKTLVNISAEKAGERAMLIATGIADYEDVYEVGYTLTVLDDEDNNITESITKYSTVTTKYYSSITSGDNVFTPAELFGDEFTAMIIWEIEFGSDYSFSFTSYAKYGEWIDGKLQYNPLDEKAENGEDKVVESKTVTFNTNGGSAVASQKVEYGTRLSSLLPINSTKAGYDVTWTIGDVDVTGNEKITSDTILTANWELNVSYNTLSYASNLLGYSWYNELGTNDNYSQGGYLTDGVYSAQASSYDPDEIIDGLTGDYVRFSIGGDTRRFGITLPSSRTLADITALRDMGYAFLKFNVYIYYQYNAGTQFTYKACNILTDAEVAGLNGTAKNIAHNQFKTIYVPIDTIISKYDKLQDHTTAILFLNAADGIDGIENGANIVWVYIGNMDFVTASGEADDYNPLFGAGGITGYSWYNEGGNVGYDGYRFTGSLVDEVAGVEGNYIRYSTAEIASSGLQDLGIKLPSTKSLSEIQELKAAGYTKLSITLYAYNDYAGSSAITHSNISFIVSAYSRTGVTDRSVPFNAFTTVELNIDDIINNYNALQNGSKALIYIWNRSVAPDGLTADGVENGSNSWGVYISDLKFVGKDDYNQLYSMTGIEGCSWYNEAYQGGTNVGFDGWIFEGTYESAVAGVNGNYVRFLSDDCKGSGVQDFGIKLPSTKSLEQIQALKDEGYTKLSIKLYAYNNYAADSTFDHKNISFIAKTNDDGNTDRSALYNESVSFNMFTTVELDIDDIIDNYSALQNGTKALIYIWNRNYAPVGLIADGGENGSNLWGVYISDLKFVTD